MPEYTKSSFHASSLRAYSPAGVLSEVSNELGLSQGIVIPPDASLVVTSGQLGLREDGTLPENIEEQVMLAFANAETTLKDAGVSDGWKSVYQITTYAPSLSDEWVAAVLKAKEQYMGNNRPAWTGVTVLGLYKDAVIEITLNAFIAAKSN